jgi:hypothetical protein
MRSHKRLFRRHRERFSLSPGTAETKFYAAHATKDAMYIGKTLYVYRTGQVNCEVGHTASSRSREPWLGDWLGLATFETLKSAF